MGIREWMKQRLADDPGGDLPPSSSLMDTLLGREQVRTRALGEYDAQSYPADLVELLRRRERVSEALLEIDIADPDARTAAIPRLRELLQTYPHPLVYETLINAFLDAGRFDEARGVAFAARERREECARSPHPEVRTEIDRLRAWTVEEVEELRAERRTRGSER